MQFFEIMFQCSLAWLVLPPGCWFSKKSLQVFNWLKRAMKRTWGSSQAKLSVNIIFLKNSKEETFVLDCFSKVLDYQCSTLEEEYFTVDV